MKKEKIKLNKVQNLINFFSKRKSSFIIKWFYTQLINIYTCDYGEETYSFQKILDIPLLLPLSNGEYSLSTIIKNNFKGIVYD